VSVDTYANSITHIADLYRQSAAGVPKSSLITAGCAHVYDHEPGAAGVVKPCSITVSPAGMNTDFWLVRVRVYVTGDIPAEKGQDTLVAVMVAADALADEYAGPSVWESAWIEEIGMWVAGNDLMIGREDMH
jgi:hypothetical protein